MKRFALMLSLALSISLLAGCSEVKRKAEETARGAAEHALSKTAGNVQDASDSAINKSVDGATSTDKQSQDRNALNGNSDDSGNKDNNK